MNEDILGWLLKEFVKENPNAAEAHKAFVDFGRQKLKNNPPISVFNAGYGLGIRLADMTDLVIMQPPPQVSQSHYMPITMPQRNPAMEGISSTDCVPITGKM